ncbi:MAG: ankyrin repeat domain-containing protein [Methyloprofundus sp.]|nr:ankyrin repeat domain-containing protein [Methyloprofundus sp.]
MEKKSNQEKTVELVALLHSVKNIGYWLESHSRLALDLVKQGADVNAQNKWGFTLLMHASFGDDPDMVDSLLDVDGIDVNLKNKWGTTALMIASNLDRLEIVKLLIMVDGIDVRGQNNLGYTALKSASNFDVEILIKEKLKELESKEVENYSDEIRLNLSNPALLQGLTL